MDRGFETPRKLIIAEAPIEDLLGELAERNPRAISQELKDALALRSLGKHDVDGKEGDQ